MDATAQPQISRCSNFQNPRIPEYHPIKILLPFPAAAMNSMDFDYRDWERYYIRLRNDYQSLRKISHTAPASDVKDLQTRLASVEKSLQIMKSSPMQYELVSSELARRTVIVENLKKAIVSPHPSAPPCMHADPIAGLVEPR